LRFVDLGLAGLIALSTVATLVIWNPQAADQASQRSADEAHLRDLLVDIVDRVGLVTITQDSPASLCGLLHSLSNSSVSYSGSTGGVTCIGSPGPGQTWASLTVTAGPNTVILESWYVAGA